jgi:alkylmercury lyase
MADTNTDLTTKITARIADSDASGLDTDLLIPLLRLLAGGDPVGVDQLAAACGRTVEDVRRGLRAAPDTEYDDQGRIVGQGLTLRPTAHRFTIAGQELYTWCALDTLIFPTLLARQARVESLCPSSGQTIRLTIDPMAGVTSLEPATAVVSLIAPTTGTSIRPGFCNQVHYFASPEAAADWAGRFPDSTLLAVTDAYQFATTLAARLLDQAQHPTDPTATHCC